MVSKVRQDGVGTTDQTVGEGNRCPQHGEYSLRGEGREHRGDGKYPEDACVHN